MLSAHGFLEESEALKKLSDQIKANRPGMKFLSELKKQDPDLLLQLEHRVKTAFRLAPDIKITQESDKVRKKEALKTLTKLRISLGMKV